jgi:beta-glucosidase
VDARYPSAAASAAKQADVAVVFAEQWTTESFDAADLSLPSGQDAVIAAVIKANPNTVVVVQSGGAVLMPWLDQVPAVLEAWYPGARGGEAIADVLFGDVNPSGRLPITFPASEAQLPNPVIPGWGLPDKTPFVLDMHEGAQVGYKWFATNKHKPLFPFGFGLSYTQFAYDGLSVQGGDTVTATFTLKNTGTRAGAETAQLYATVTGADGIASPRLIGWSKVALNPGEQKSVTVQADPRLLAAFDGASKQWRIKGGTYRVQLGKSSQDIQHEATTTLRARMLPAATPGSSMTVTPRAAAAPKTGLEWP